VLDLAIFLCGSLAFHKGEFCSGDEGAEVCLAGGNASLSDMGWETVASSSFDPVGAEDGGGGMTSQAIPFE
jgi:hypothetical protein